MQHISIIDNYAATDGGRVWRPTASTIGRRRRRGICGGYSIHSDETRNPKTPPQRTDYIDQQRRINRRRCGIGGRIDDTSERGAVADGKGIRGYIYIYVLLLIYLLIVIDYM